MGYKKGQYPKREGELTKEKMAVIGRPLKYTEKEIHKLADEFLDFMKEANNFWFKDFAIKKGFSAGLLSELALKNSYFSEALKKCREIQEAKIFKSAFTGKTNATMGIFALKNCHEWKDGREFTGDPNRPINITTNIPLKFDEE